MEKQNNSVSVDELQDIVPHRFPMIWVDKVISCDELGGVVEVVINKGQLYFQGENFKESSYIEFIAQAYGFIKALELKLNGGNESYSKGFLSAIDDFTIHSQWVPKDKDILKVKVETVRNLNPIFIIKGTIENNQEELASAQIKIYALANLKEFSL